MIYNFKWGNWDPEKFRGFSEVTLLMRWRSWNSEPCSMPPNPTLIVASLYCCPLHWADALEATCTHSGLCLASQQRLPKFKGNKYPSSPSSSRMGLPSGLARTAGKFLDLTLIWTVAENGNPVDICPPPQPLHLLGWGPPSWGEKAILFFRALPAPSSLALPVASEPRISFDEVFSQLPSFLLAGELEMSKKVVK